jgi:hypothetical protein
MLGYYLLKGDTATMLLPYLRKADTLAMSNLINLKVNIADTGTMLLPYLRKADTLTMLAPYLHEVDTTGKWISYITREAGTDSIFYYKNGVATFAFRDSAGTSVDTTNLPYYRHVKSVNDTTLTIERPSSRDTLVFRSSVSYVSLSRFINSSVTGTNANITASAGVAYYLPAATLTTNKSITIPAGNDMDYIEIYNLESGYLWTLAGAAVYLSDGITALTHLNANTNYQIRFIGSKWRISN